MPLERAQQPGQKALKGRSTAPRKNTRQSRIPSGCGRMTTAASGLGSCGATLMCGFLPCVPPLDI